MAWVKINGKNADARDVVRALNEMGIHARFDDKLCAITGFIRENQVGKISQNIGEFVQTVANGLNAIVNPEQATKGTGRS